MPTIHFERQGRIALITLQGDTDLNLGCVNQELHERLIEYRDDDELWCAVITGAGERAFSAGADLKATAARGGFGDSFWSVSALDLLSGAEFWKPLVAAVNGYALGAGMMLALGCDVRICSDTATFGLPEVKYGFPPGMGAALRLPRMMPLGPALELLLTGDRITAEQAYHWGLVNRVVPRADLMDEALKLARAHRGQPAAGRPHDEGDHPARPGPQLRARISPATDALAHRPPDRGREGGAACLRRAPQPEFKGR